MRSDLNKVITERPRRGSRGPNYKHGFSVHDPDPEREYDHLPKTEGILPYRRLRGQGKFDSKEFTDKLGAIRGFLHKNVGRPWDKVYSEICATLKRNTLQNIHALDTHLMPEVELNVELWVKGKKKNVPVDAKDHRELRQTFYVNPKSGLLCWVGGKRFRSWKVKPDLNDAGYEWVREAPDVTNRRRFWGSKEPKPEPHTVLKISSTEYAILKNGVWIRHIYTEHVERDRSSFYCTCQHNKMCHSDWKTGVVHPCIKCGCIKFVGQLMYGPNSTHTSYHLQSTKVLNKKEKKAYGI